MSEISKVDYRFKKLNR